MRGKDGDEGAEKRNMKRIVTMEKKVMRVTTYEESGIVTPEGKTRIVIPEEEAMIVRKDSIPG